MNSSLFYLFEDHLLRPPEKERERERERERGGGGEEEKEKEERDRGMEVVVNGSPQARPGCSGSQLCSSSSLSVCKCAGHLIGHRAVVQSVPVSMTVCQT